MRTEPLNLHRTQAEDIPEAIAAAVPGFFDALEDGDSRKPAITEWIWQSMLDRRPAHMRLAHPVKTLSGGHLLRDHLPELWSACRGIDAKGGAFQDLLVALAQHPAYGPVTDAWKDILASHVSPSLDAKGHASETLMSALAAEWYDYKHGTAFDVTLELQRQLANTDVAGVPAAFIRPPFPATFIRFQPGEDSPKDVAGAYVFETPVTDDYSRVTIMLVVPTENGNTWIGDAFCFDLDAKTRDESIVDMVASANHRGPDEAVYNVTKAIDDLSKVLLYMNSREQRGDKETATWRHGVPVAESVRRAYKGGRLPIVIGPSKASHAQTSTPGVSGRQMPVHWRRGHFRHVRHGVGKTESKLMFIAPTLVNAEKLAGEDPLKKTYKVVADAPSDPQP